jgi:hypothetical protein
MTNFYYPPSKNATQKTLGAQLLAGVTSAATLNNVVGIQNKAGIFVVDRVDTNNVETPAKREYISYAGTSGSTVVTLVRNVDGSSTDMDHAIGAIVEFTPNITEEQAIIDTILVEHNDGGTHGSATVTTLKASAAVVTTGTSDVTIVTPKSLRDATHTFTKPVINGTNPTGATYTPATGAQTVALDCAANNLHIVTGHADGTAITFTIANATNNQPFIVSILQGAVVSTITGWFATCRWSGGTAPTLTATLNKRDTFGFIRTGTNTYDGFIIGQNA